MWQARRKTSKDCVEKVLLELKKNYTHLPDKLVATDHHIDKMVGLLNVDSNGVKTVGIHGMGGLGKTTVVNVIYKLICKHFERSCFLEDVRDKLQHHNGIVKLQCQLLTKILNREISNIVGFMKEQIESEARFMERNFSLFLMMWMRNLKLISLQEIAIGSVQEIESLLQQETKMFYTRLKQLVKE